MRLLKFIKKVYSRFFFDNETYLKRLGVHIGSNCKIGSRNFGSEPYLVSIGNHVQITDNVHFFTHGGGWVFRQEMPDFDIFGKIIIKDNVYIGSGSYILPGVTVENNVIIGARSVVTKSIPEGVIVAGNPAKIIGNLNDYKHNVLKYNLETKRLNSVEKRKLLLSLPDDKFLAKTYLKS